jgi:hypothetical protein
LALDAVLLDLTRGMEKSIAVPDDGENMLLDLARCTDAFRELIRFTKFSCARVNESADFLELLRRLAVLMTAQGNSSYRADVVRLLCILQSVHPYTREVILLNLSMSTNGRCGSCKAVDLINEHLVAVGKSCRERSHARSDRSTNRHLLSRSFVDEQRAVALGASGVSGGAARVDIAELFECIGSYKNTLQDELNRAPPRKKTWAAAQADLAAYLSRVTSPSAREAARPSHRWFDEPPGPMYDE